MRIVARPVTVYHTPPRISMLCSQLVPRKIGAGMLCPIVPSPSNNRQKDAFHSRKSGLRLFGGEGTFRPKPSLSIFSIGHQNFVGMQAGNRPEMAVGDRGAQRGNSSQITIAGP